MFRARDPAAQGPLVLGSAEHQPLFNAIADACAECGINGVALKACGSCRRAHYCNKECQRAHWKNGHKDECFPAESLHVPSAEAPTVAAALALAKPGATIILSAGTYDDELTVDKCVKIRGAGVRAGESAAAAAGVIIAKPLRVTSNASGAVELRGLTLCRGLVLDSRTVQATVKRCTISNPSGSGIKKTDGSLTISDSSISDCEDGVLNQAGGLAVVRCQIEDCNADGIFSNPHISVTDCTVRCVGRNGIKSRGGVTRLGKCDIQASQWDAVGEQGPYGGMFRF